MSGVPSVLAMSLLLDSVLLLPGLKRLIRMYIIIFVNVFNALWMKNWIILATGLRKLGISSRSPVIIAITELFSAIRTLLISISVNILTVWILLSMTLLSVPLTGIKKLLNMKEKLIKRLLTVSAILLMMVCLFSCGSPRSAVRVLNNADATTDVHVSVGSGGSTTVQVDPKVDSSLNFKLK